MSDEFDAFHLSHFFVIGNGNSEKEVRIFSLRGAHLLAMFARLGEQTGQLPVMLQRAAQQLGNEVQRRAMQMATILEPLLIVGMGGVVMLIVLAVLMPIIQLNQLVK